MKPFITYNFALELDRFFKDRDGAFENSEFIELVDALQAVGGEKSQQRAVDFFKKLNKKDVLDRVKTICKLNKILKNIKSNNV